jgi:hypothetical protein
MQTTSVTFGMIGRIEIHRLHRDACGDSEDHTLAHTGGLLRIPAGSAGPRPEARRGLIIMITAARSAPNLKPASLPPKLGWPRSRPLCSWYSRFLGLFKLPTRAGRKKVRNANQFVERGSCS